MKKLFLSLLIFALFPFFAVAQEYKPIIGVSATESSPASTPSTYVNAVKRAGGVPVVIPITTDSTQIAAILSVVDAVVMTGGADIDPLKYMGEEPIRALGEITPTRDEFDMMLIKMAVKRGLPLFGICRGEQLLNVAFGGTLYQDIPSQAGAYIKHNQDAPGSYGTHSIDIEKNSLIYKLLGSEKAVVNSFHHQAVKEPAPGFKVTAKSKDGIVEAIEMVGTDKVWGTQFHPESFVNAGDDFFLPLFEHLVKKAKEYRAGK